MGAIRAYEVNSGPETASVSTTPTPTASAHLVPYGWLMALSSDVTIGSIASPIDVTNNSQIAVASTFRQRKVVQGSGGAVNALLANGTIDGQEITLIGANDTNTITMEYSSTLRLNGTIVLSQDKTLTLIWLNSDAIWIEKCRSA